MLKNIVESTRNAVGNVHNPCQGDDKKVLVVCAAGLLRSPTMAHVLHKELGYNTRACGSAKDFALVPLSEALVVWTDEIVFTDVDAYDYLWKEDQEFLEEWCKKVLVLDIPDNFNYMDEGLQQVCLEQYLMSA